MHRNIYPFSAIIGQEPLKLGLLLNAVNPGIGGVLIRGEKGTAKSTAVRALAELLPDIDVVEGCPFSCDPDHQQDGCDYCRGIGKWPPKRIHRRVRVVDLPLNATEDRVAGGIDFSLTVKQGRRALQPGLLASAHRGILYVDEVNLLDDHLVDIILDAASSGENIIEREGMSFRHPARFILIGTMNPEEGELRPQLLDRFGLCVEIAGIQSPDDRALLMEKREAFDSDPKGFIDGLSNENTRITLQIENARKRLSSVKFPRHLRTFITELCMENCVAGHRADIIMEQAARALAALRADEEVTADHIHEISPMVLLHRRRDVQPPPSTPPTHEDESKDQDETHQEPDQDENPPPQNRKENQSRENQSGPENQGSGNIGDVPDHESTEPEKADDQIFEIGATFKIKNISSAKDRVFRRGSGRRSRTRVSQKQGRYVKSRLGHANGDIALDATLRAAAPYQKERGNNNGLCMTLTEQDIRGRIREKRIGNYLFFLVDASGSMGARGRMAASKGAIMSLLLDAYQKRDKVAMISFRRNEAVINLQPTTSVDLAGRLLAEMPIGGRTPLSAGLTKTYEQVRNIFFKDPGARPIIIVITDGKSNVALGDQKPIEEALQLITVIARDERIKLIIVDTEEEGLITFGFARHLAASAGAQYFKIDNLKAETLVDIAKGQH